MAKSKATKSRTMSQIRSGMIIAIIAGALALLGSIFFTIANWDYMVMGNTVNLNESVRNGGSPQKGDHVSFRVYFVFGNFAETKHRINGIIPAGTEQHFAVMLDDGSVMALTIRNKSDIEKLESLANTNWDLLAADDSGWAANYIDITGTIKNMNTEILKYYKDALRNADITTEYYTNIYDFSLDATDSRLSYFGIAGFLLLITGICVILIFSSKKKMKKLKELQSIAKENAADPSLNPFLQGASIGAQDTDAANGPAFGAQGADAANGPAFGAQGGYDPSAYNAQGGYDPSAYNAQGGYDPSAYNAQGGYDPSAYNGSNDPNNQ